MDEDLERRVRASLRTRAEDVEVTPDLWRAVERRLGRRRRRIGLWAGAGTVAAAVAALAVAVSLTSDGGPGDVVVDPAEDSAPEEPAGGATTEPPPTPTGEPTGTSTPGVGQPDALVWTDGDAVFLGDTDGSDPTVLHDLPDDADVELVDVSVRPGSTRDGYTVVVTRSGEGRWDHWWITGGAERTPQARPFPDRYAVSANTAPGARPRAVWSPDGRHVAWVETPAGEAATGPTLRVLGWADGPGTGADADDDAGFVLDGVPLEFVPTLADWRWDTVADDRVASGRLLLTNRNLDVLAVPIERRADGAIADPGRASLAYTESDGAVVDLDSGYAGHMVVWGGGQPGPHYTLSVRSGGGTDELAVALRSTAELAPDDGEGEEVALPDELATVGFDEARELWLEALGDGAVVGLADTQAWFVPADGDAARLPAGTRAADLLADGSPAGPGESRLPGEVATPTASPG